MNKFIFSILLTLGSILALQAQSDRSAKDSDKQTGERHERMEERRDRMESLKIAYITKELDLTSEESQKFWPIYNSYQKEIRAMRKESRSSIKMDEMSDKEAEVQLLKRLEMDEKKIELQREVIKDLTPVIGAQRVLQLTKVEKEFKRKVLQKAGMKGKEGKNKNKNKRKGKGDQD